ncbi:MAG: hypothetical protein WEE89_08765 [Gemmatimonadota bacterium]
MLGTRVLGYHSNEALIPTSVRAFMVKNRSPDAQLAMQQSRLTHSKAFCIGPPWVAMAKTGKNAT